MTVHMPDRNAVPTLFSSISAGNPSLAFQHDRGSGTWSASGSDGSTGIMVSSDGSIIVTAPAGSFRMHYSGFSRNGELSVAKAETIRADRDQLSIDRGTVMEWYRYIPGSPEIEQGMTIAARPEGSGPFAVTYQLSGDLQPRLAGETLLFFDTTGPVLQYSGLSAHDATGRTLPANLALSGTSLSWQIDDQDAVYPVTIDPTIAGQTTILNASHLENLEYFGDSVSLNNNTALVGAYNDDVGGLVNAGQAYVFKNSGGTWTQTAILNASNAAGGANFGWSVSLWNDTAVVGADSAYVSGYPNRGQAYVFKNSGGTWAQTAILNASDGADYDNFGYSVSIYNDTALIGAKYAMVDTAGNAGQAYVFKNSGGTWTQTAILNASDAAGDANFGHAVFLVNDTALIGAIEADVGTTDAGQAYVFKDTGGTWAQTAILNASDPQQYAKFGWSVWFYNDTAVIGAPQDDFGGNTDAGQAYVFKNSGGTWTQTAILNASDAGLNGNFGYAVSVYNDTAVIGAYGAKVGGTSWAGQAYVFKDSGGAWTQTAILTAPDASSQADAKFGGSLSLLNETNVLIGAKDANVGSVTNAGQVYVIILAEGSAPVASFTSANVSIATNSTNQGWAGVRPFTMQFTDTSANMPTSWKWARQNLTDTTWRVFNTSQNARDSFWTGNWSVNLTATNAAGYNVSTQTLWLNVSQDALTVTGITPSSGQNTTTVSITNMAGTGFYGTPVVNLTRTGYSNITATSVTLVFANQLTCTFDLTSRIPGAWNVNVTNPDGQQAALLNGFTILNGTAAAPTVTGITPISGTTAGGPSVTVTGTGFYGGTSSSTVTAVKFGTTPATSYTVNSDTSITATSPAGSVGTVDITVTAGGGTSAISASDQFTYSSPVTSSASSGASGGGDSASDSGTGLASVSDISPGQASAFSFNQNIGVNQPVALNSVQITFSQHLGTVSVYGTTVNQGFSVPVGQNVVGYLQITPIGVNENAVTQGVITFTVDGQYLSSHNMNPAQIVMMRDHDGQWTALPTTLIGQNGNTYTYQAITPGFSYYAIVVNTPGSSENVTVSQTPVPANVTVNQVVTTGPVTTSQKVVPSAGATATAVSTETTAVPASPQPAPGLPLMTVALIGAGCVVIIGCGFVVRRWWIRRQNPALFRKND
jgi:PGF-pre-PGF domain-containing protein